MEEEKDQKNPPRCNNKSANIIGAAIVFFGFALLMRNLGFPFLGSFLHWEMILIIIGVVIGINSNFEKKSSIILMTIGGLFLLKRVLDLSFGGVIIPLAAIILGIYFIARNRQRPHPPVPPQTASDPKQQDFDWDKRIAIDPEQGTQQTKGSFQYEGENYVKVESIFGSAKKVIFSKNFLGGTMTNLFGSTEINLLQADIQQPVALDIFQLCGSTKIIVPPHWAVVSTSSAILSENDDRRVILTQVPDQDKCLYITGTSICGSITIKNS